MGSQARAPSVSYEDFDPSFEWVRGDSDDVVIIHLPGFKREQLKVQTDSSGNLRTSGNRPADGNRRIRFWKDFRVPENCTVKGIRAKFENQKLHVSFPKSVAVEPVKAPAPAPEEPRAPAPVPPAAQTQRATAEDDEKQQQEANGKSTDPVTARQDLDRRKEEEEKLKPKEEGKPSGAEKKAAPAPAPSPRQEDTDEKEEFESEEEEKPTAAVQKTAPAPAPEETRSSDTKTDSKSSDEKKVVQLPAATTSSKPGHGGVQGATEGLGVLGVGMGGLTQARKGLLLNVAVATMVLLALAFYLKHKLTKAETE